MSTVTVGVPVYKGEEFLGEALRSIQLQTHRDLDVVISLDGEQPAAQEICEPFLKDSRFRLIVQQRRLGWAANIDWLMAQVESGFWYYHQQDDLVDEHYVETLLEYAELNPEAAVAYCDMQTFGRIETTVQQTSVLGAPSTRQLTLLQAHFPAVAFRGLTRAEAIANSARMRLNDCEDFAADTTWMAAAARSGELHRVPVVMYRKRYHAENTSVKWLDWALDKRIRAWAVHCADMLTEALLVDASEMERRLLWLAAVHRLRSERVATGFLPMAELTGPQEDLLLRAFLKAIGAREFDLEKLLSTDWRQMRKWTEDNYRRPVNRRLREKLRRRIPTLSRGEST